MFDWLAPAAGIVLIDLVLSGDNAVVIGAAAAGLSRSRRLLAIVLGGSGAILLRIVFALAATLLLNLHYLGIVGGVILLFIAARLLLDRSKEQQQAAQRAASDTEASNSPSSRTQDSRAQRSFVGAIFTILIADVTMSLDNVLAVAGLAREAPVLLIGGLLLSISILLIGSALVAEMINRLPWLLDVACLVVSWTAAHIFLTDKALQPIIEQYSWLEVVGFGVALLLVAAFDLYLFLRDRRNRPESA